MSGGQINKSPVSNFLMMLCAKNYCTLLIFGRVIFKIERGAFVLRHSVYTNDNAVTSSDSEYLSKSESNGRKSYSSKSKKVTHIFSTLK